MAILALLAGLVRGPESTPFRVPAAPHSVDFYVGPRRSWWYP